MVDIENSSHALKQFLRRDGGRIVNSDFKCRSVLLQIKRDMDFILCHFDNPTSYQLSNAGVNALYRNRPMVAPILLFCTAVDLSSVVIFNRPKDQVGKYFKKTLQDFYNQDKSTSKLVWDLRNALAHEYSHMNMVVSPIHPAGTTNVAETRGALTYIYSEKMREILITALGEMNAYILNQPSKTQTDIIERIRDRGLYKVRGKFKKSIQRPNGFTRTN